MKVHHTVRCFQPADKHDRVHEHNLGTGDHRVRWSLGTGLLDREDR
jgi:hypothetical protein